MVSPGGSSSSDCEDMHGGDSSVSTGVTTRAGSGVFAQAQWRCNRYHKGFKFEKATNFVRALVLSLNFHPNRK